MTDSILNTIKQMVGVEPDYDAFDMDLVVDINSAFYSLRQLGVGPNEGFTISDETAKWNEFVEDSSLLSLVKTYIYLKVRMLFDPPTNSFLTASIEKQISEYEWRLNVAGEGAFDKT